MRWERSSHARKSSLASARARSTVAGEVKTSTSNRLRGRENVGRSRQQPLIDYAVHFVKANGLTGRKVFKLRRLVLAAAVRVQLGDSISFKPMTTRHHYPGHHPRRRADQRRCAATGSVPCPVAPLPLLWRQRFPEALEPADSLKPVHGIAPGRCDARERQLEDAGGHRQVRDRRS